MSRFDVIVPCYKYGHFLHDCVQSALSQDGIDLRVLILDDASPDNTPEVAAEIVRKDTRVTYRRHEVNRGHIDTYNEGFAWASGDYVMLLSPDDQLSPGALARTAKVMEANPEVGLAYGQQVLFTDTRPPLQAPSEQDFALRILTSQEFLNTACKTASNPITTATAMMRTSLLHSIGGFDKALPHSADMEMWFRLAARSSVVWIDALQAYKRIHQSNMQHQVVRAPLGDLRERHAAFEFFFQKDGHLLDDCQSLRSLAHRGLAADAFWAASRAFDGRDISTCRQFLDIACKLNPEVRASSEWRRLTWKRRVGPRVWSLLRPVVEWFRNNPLHATAHVAP